MDYRTYILLDIVDGKAEQAVKVLRKSPGVVMVDVVEGPPDICILIEALNRENLAKLTVQALASVENITENVCLLPVRNRTNNNSKSKLFPPSRLYDNKPSSKPPYQSNKANSIP